jgi:RNA polymerase sigma factor (sigma-70 family)
LYASKNAAFAMVQWAVKKFVPFGASAHTYHQMQPADDSVLLRQYANDHSDEAFATLVTRYVNFVYSIAVRQVGNPHHAEEITQVVFIILSKKALRLRHERALSSWLFNTTRLTAINFVRSETRRHRREQEAYMQTIFDKSGEDLWPRMAPLLDDAVAALSEQERRAIVLRFYEGRNLREVGDALCAGEEAAKKRVMRGLEKLQKYFLKRGVNSTTAIIAGAISANSVHAAPVTLAKSVTAIALAKGAGAGAATLALTRGTLAVISSTKVALLVGTATIATIATITFISSWFHFGNETIDDQIAQVTLPGTTGKDMIRVMGEPKRYWIADARGHRTTLHKKNLPDVYLMSYPNGIQAALFKDRVFEVEAVTPGLGFSYHGLHLGSTLDDVLQVLGPPTETISGHPAKNFMPYHLSGFGGVLYTDIGGQAGKSYYWRPDQGVRFMLMKGVVWEICIDVPNYWPPNN